MFQILLCSRTCDVLGDGDILVNKIKMFSFLEFAFRLREHANILLAKIIFVVVELLSCVKLFCAPMHCSLQSSSVCGILQARILEWVAISFSRGSS